jgi:hypothetical protein
VGRGVSRITSHLVEHKLRCLPRIKGVLPSWDSRGRDAFAPVKIAVEMKKIENYSDVQND